MSYIFNGKIKALNFQIEKQIFTCNLEIMISQEKIEKLEICSNRFTMYDLIERLLKIVDAHNIEDISDKIIRVEMDGRYRKILNIGHIMENIWLNDNNKLNTKNKNIGNKDVQWKEMSKEFNLPIKYINRIRVQHNNFINRYGDKYMKYLKPYIEEQFREAKLGTEK